MADVLNLERNDRRSFFEDRMRHFEGASDDEIAQNVLDQLPPMAFMESFADAKELVMHFQAIAEGWLFEICDRN